LKESALSLAKEIGVRITRDPRRIEMGLSGAILASEKNSEERREPVARVPLMVRSER
jgi:hypothetical protein